LTLEKTKNKSRVVRLIGCCDDCYVSCVAADVTQVVDHVGAAKNSLVIINVSAIVYYESVIVMTPRRKRIASRARTPPSAEMRLLASIVAWSV